MPELVIVGGGPAGLTAAVYCLRQRLDLLLLTEELGGKANDRQEFPGAEEYRVIRGTDLVGRFRNEVAYLSAAHRLVRVQAVEQAAAKGTQKGEGFRVRLSGGAEIGARAVILATGSRQEHLQLPGAERYAFKGLGFSALGYAHLFLERTAVVVGSGARAVSSALHLAGGARQVHLVAAPGSDLDKALAGARSGPLRGPANLRYHAGAEAVELRGDDFARELGIRTAEGIDEVLSADGFFLLGEPVPNTEAIRGLLGGLQTDAAGRLQVDSGGATGLPGLFAAGDVTASSREQILAAVGDGAKTALAALEYLRGS